jgi:iron complex outermembrane receptor protein
LPLHESTFIFFRSRKRIYRHVTNASDHGQKFATQINNSEIMAFKSKLIVLLSTFLSIAFMATAQKTGSVTGRVLTSDGQPAASVSIQLLKTSWGTVTGDNGEFRISSIRPGNYTLTASAVGLAAEEKTITITTGQTTQADFSLKQNASELQEVIISNRNLNRQNNIISKMPLKNLENPQVYSTVNSELLKQQNIANFDDAMRNVPGLTRTWESTGRAGDGGAYFALRGFEAQPCKR